MYDVIIVGCGPAGLTAGIYTSRAGFKTAIFEKETIGGQMSTSPLIENYPGYESISGSELSFKMYDQALKSGVSIEVKEVKEITKNSVITDDGEYKAKVIIIASGAKYRHLNVDNEEDYIGKGVHFCTACDGAFYKDKVVAVVGGANSAVTNAIYLSNICKKVYLIYRGDTLKCEKVLLDKLDNMTNIEILYNTNITKLNGNNNLESITINDKDTISLDGVFVSIGSDPVINIASNLLEIENNGFTYRNTTTKYDNIFVAGDCTNKNVKQIATAVSDGATAGTYAINYLNKRSK